MNFMNRFEILIPALPLILFISLPPAAGTAQGDTHTRNSGPHITKDVRCILQDKSGAFWFATDGEGVCRYDGRAFTWLTEKEGLASNFVRTIQIDDSGSLWFATRDGFSRYDGQTFTTFTDNPALRSFQYRLTARKQGSDGLWFAARDGAFYCENGVLSFLPLPLDKADIDLRKSQPGLNQSAYDIYATLKDRDGNLWFCTESRGAYRFDGSTFTRVSSTDLDRPIRAAFQDSKGAIWFGNNGEGLFRYDGTTLINVTKEKGLGNPDFAKSLKGKPGTVGRVWTINEDTTGDLWIGTFDAGLWRYDGRTMKNYTTADGLSSDCITTSYRDASGVLWFGTGNGGAYRFDGKKFVAFPK